MLTRYLTLAFGDDDGIHTQVFHALLTVLAHAPRPRELVVLTDAPRRYRFFGDAVTALEVDAAMLKSWQGPHDFFWRIKLKALERALDLGPAHLVYLDGDVVCRRDLGSMIERIEAGEVFMHCNEGLLARSRRRGNRRLYREIENQIWGGIAADASTEMWNAGITAFSAGHAQLIARATDVCDELCAAGAVQHVTEQLATSMVLATTGRLAEAQPWFDHYWGNKPGYRAAIERQLAIVMTRGYDHEEAATFAREHPINLPLLVRPRRWQKLLQRWK
jgi:hypothetical protein